MSNFDVQKMINSISVFGCFTKLGHGYENTYPMFPLFMEDKVKTPEQAVKKAIAALENISAGVVHGSKVG